jgi:hypothetical protein
VDEAWDREPLGYLPIIDGTSSTPYGPDSMVLVKKYILFNRSVSLVRDTGPRYAHGLGTIMTSRCVIRAVAAVIAESAETFRRVMRCGAVRVD